ncbi:MAG TPA: TonB-dependent siderophore receptor [Nostocaceae cyanobacterium]|nr:TonB-dependent siderophore receptor [Nostocaceae cyanobacterium]
MKSDLIKEMRSLGLLLVVIGSLVKPAYANNLEELPNLKDKKSYSSSAEQLLAQSNAVNKITGVRVNSTEKGIEVILESANAENLKPANVSQGNNFIIDIPNTTLALPQGKNFNLDNPDEGIVSVSVNQTNNNTTRLIVTGKDGLPSVEVFDGDEGLIFEFIPTTTANTNNATTATLAQITDIKLNPTNTGTELVLTTSAADKLQVAPRQDGKTFIIDIPEAQIANNSSFCRQQPITGISEILAINIDANTIRLSITGEANVPTVELFEDDAGLIFSIVPAATSQPDNSTPTEQPTPDNSTPTEQPTPDNQTPTEQPTTSQEPIELTVTATPDAGYLVPEASTGTKLEVPLRDVPASIQVIPKEVISDRQVVRLNELADNVSGVRPQATLGGLASQGYFIRGFASGFEALRDGYRDFGFTSPRDVANIERVEFLKGPSSVLYGSASSPGGVVNTITKKPLSDPFYQIGGTFGSYDFYRGTIDLTGSLTENRAALYRLNLAYENANSFRDFVDNESVFINPVVSVKVGETTDLTFAYEYQKYDYAFDRGFPSNSTVVFDLPVSRYLDEPSLNDSQYTSNNFAYNLESQFGYNNNWKFRQGFNILNVTGITRGSQTVAINPDGQTVSRRYRISDSQQQNIAFQNEISGKFNTGTIRHNILVGLELANYQFQDDFYRGTIAPINIFNPVYGAQPENVRRNLFGEYGGQNVALYLQDLIELTPNLKFLAGGRFDWVNSYDTNFIADTTTKTSDSEFSPRLGIVYQPTDTTSIYASWTNSFNPQIFGRNSSNEPFKPEKSEQFEVGIKQDFLDNRLSATLAFFDITKQNVLNFDIDGFGIQTGEQKSRGIELDVVGEISPGWKIIGTYAYTDAYVSEDNDINTLNDRLAGVPYHSASLWTTYEFQQGNLQGLGLGLGLVYAGEREATLPNNIQIPSYLRTDASIFYKQNNWRAALNFKNLFDNKYYEAQGFYIVPAAPLTVIGNITFEF